MSEIKKFYWKDSEFNLNGGGYEISEQKMQELINGQAKGLEIYTKENGEPDLRKFKPSEEFATELLRQRREGECFSIINRGKLWYDALSPQQLQQLSSWYKEWLNVTETKILPQKPEWIK